MEKPQKVGISNKYIKVLVNLYSRAGAFVSLEKPGMRFRLQRGVKQEDTLSPNIFNSVLEEVFQKFQWDSLCIKIIGRWLTSIRFADDIILVGKNVKELEKMLDDLVMECRLVGLEIHSSKTKLLARGEATEEILVDDCIKEILKTFPGVSMVHMHSIEPGKCKSL